MTNPNKLTLLKINDEIFAMNSDTLTKEQRIAVESLVEYIDEEYADEVEGMDVYALSSWFQAKVKEEFGISFETVGIDHEFIIKIQ